MLVSHTDPCPSRHAMPGVEAKEERGLSRVADVGNGRGRSPEARVTLPDAMANDDMSYRLGAGAIRYSRHRHLGTDD